MKHSISWRRLAVIALSCALVACGSDKAKISLDEPTGTNNPPTGTNNPPTGTTNPPPAPTNRAPTISGVPASGITTGQTYSFQPTASDPDGQALTYSVTRLPAWATFNASTGRLSGTPSSSYTGTFTGIVISVSDGRLSAALPAFSITVSAAQAAQMGSATLRWTPPTRNEDGTPIENLSGYRVYYGTSTSNLNQVVTISSAGITSARIENLTPATWYFALKAYNSANVESRFSNIASKTIT
jgi:hypothetical protein